MNSSQATRMSKWTLIKREGIRVALEMSAEGVLSPV
jgi:hypothetical protein